jgi:hypothetical protein
MQNYFVTTDQISPTARTKYYCLEDVIHVNQFGKVRWTRHVAHMKTTNSDTISIVKPIGEYTSVYKMIILKRILDCMGAGTLILDLFQLST